MDPIENGVYSSQRHVSLPGGIPQFGYRDSKKSMLRKAAEIDQQSRDFFFSNFSGYLAPTNQSTRGATAKMSGLFFGVKLFVLTLYQLTMECKINVGQDTLKKALTKGRTTCGDEAYFQKNMEANQPKQHPRHPVIFSADDWGVQSPPKRIGFRFHETILRFGEPGSLGAHVMVNF